MSIDDLSFEGDYSNYELNIIDKPARFSYDSKILKKNYFSNDTLNLNFGTGAGVNKLKIEIKSNTSSMQITILNMTYDNDYLIDLSRFTSGNYTFDWQKIDACQSQNKTSRIIECQGMNFLQLDLQSKNSKFNHNKIKLLCIENFRNKKDDSIKIKNKEKNIKYKKAGEIKNREIIYTTKFADFNSNLPEYLSFYITENEKEYEIFNTETNGAYIGEIQCFKVDNNDFIYIKLNETSGIQYGHFYSIDVINKEAKKVIEDFGDYQIPDSLENYSGFGILKDVENKFYSGLLLRSKKKNEKYVLTRTHKLILNENNEFVLKVVDNKLTEGQY